MSACGTCQHGAARDCQNALSGSAAFQGLSNAKPAADGSCAPQHHGRCLEIRGEGPVETQQAPATWVAPPGYRRKLCKATTSSLSHHLCFTTPHSDSLKFSTSPVVQHVTLQHVLHSDPDDSPSVPTQYGNEPTNQQRAWPGSTELASSIPQ